MSEAAADVVDRSTPTPSSQGIVSNRCSAPVVVRPPPSTSLYHFIRRDIIVNEGHHILVRFLTTNDLLRLSECCKPFVNYRHHLSRLKTVSHPSDNITMRRALFVLLAKQHCHVEYLMIGDPGFIGVLDCGRWALCPFIRVLKIYLHGMQELNDDQFSAPETGIRRWQFHGPGGAQDGLSPSDSDCRQ